MAYYPEAKLGGEIVQTRKTRYHIIRGSFHQAKLTDPAVTNPGDPPLQRGSHGGPGDDLPPGEDACGQTAGGGAQLPRVLPAVRGGERGDAGAVGAQAGLGVPVSCEQAFFFFLELCV